MPVAGKEGVMITPDELRKCAVCVYLAADEGPANNISNHLKQAANTIEALETELHQKKEEIESLKDVWLEVKQKDELLRKAGEVAQAVIDQAEMPFRCSCGDFATLPTGHGIECKVTLAQTFIDPTYPEYGDDEYDAGYEAGFDAARDKYQPRLEVLEKWGRRIIPALIWITRSRHGRTYYHAIEIEKELTQAHTLGLMGE